MQAELYNKTRQYPWSVTLA